MKKFWWGIFFAVLLSVVLLAPESNLANRIRDLFYALQDSAVATLNAALANPVKAALAFAVGFACLGGVNYLLDPATPLSDRKSFTANLCGGFLFLVLSIVACAHPELIEQLK